MLIIGDFFHLPILYWSLGVGFKDIIKPVAGEAVVEAVVVVGAVKD